MNLPTLKHFEPMVKFQGFYVRVSQIVQAVGEHARPLLLDGSVGIEFSDLTDPAPGKLIRINYCAGGHSGGIAAL